MGAYGSGAACIPIFFPAAGAPQISTDSGTGELWNRLHHFRSWPFSRKNMTSREQFSHFEHANGWSITKLVDRAYK
jgi:hypothetical protein